FLPRPVQQPRIPIWVAGFWPSKAPFRRAARWDGACPLSRNVEWDQIMPPEEVQATLAYIHSQRDSDVPFDVTVGGVTPGDDPTRATAIVALYVAAGMTWWIESMTPQRGLLDEMRQRIRQGPPKL